MNERIEKIILKKKNCTSKKTIYLEALNPKLFSQLQ